MPSLYFALRNFSRLQHDNTTPYEVWHEPQTFPTHHSIQTDCLPWGCNRDCLSFVWQQNAPRVKLKLILSEYASPWTNRKSHDTSSVRLKLETICNPSSLPLLWIHSPAKLQTQIMSRRNLHGLRTWGSFFAQQRKSPARDVIFQFKKSILQKSSPTRLR